MHKENDDQIYESNLRRGYSESAAEVSTTNNSMKTFEHERMRVVINVHDNMMSIEFDAELSILCISGNRLRG